LTDFPSPSPHSDRFRRCAPNRRTCWRQATLRRGLAGCMASPAMPSAPPSCSRWCSLRYLRSILHADPTASRRAAQAGGRPPTSGSAPKCWGGTSTPASSTARAVYLTSVLRVANPGLLAGLAIGLVADTPALGGRDIMRVIGWTDVDPAIRLACVMALTAALGNVVLFAITIAEIRALSVLCAASCCRCAKQPCVDAAVVRARARDEHTEQHLCNTLAPMSGPGHHVLRQRHVIEATCHSSVPGTPPNVPSGKHHGRGRALWQ